MECAKFVDRDEIYLRYLINTVTVINEDGQEFKHSKVDGEQTINDFLTVSANYFKLTPVGHYDLCLKIEGKPTGLYLIFFPFFFAFF